MFDQHLFGTTLCQYVSVFQIQVNTFQ